MAYGNMIPRLITVITLLALTKVQCFTTFMKLKHSTSLKMSDAPKGRNRDADAVANSADVYFAQLKLDSRIRKQAFLSGEEEQSNKVFEDQRVKDLGDALENNPYVKSRKQKSLENMEFTADEMTTMIEEAQAERKANNPQTEPEEPLNNQVTYREKLEEAKRRRNQGGVTPTASAPPQPIVSAPPQPIVSAPPQPVATATPPPAVQSSPAPVTPAVVPATVGTGKMAASEEEIIAALQYAEAAINMFKTAPDTEKKNLIPLVRSALISSMEKLD